MDQPQNLYPAQNGQVGGVEPLMYNQGQPMVTAQPIPQASSMAPMNQPIVDPIYGTQPIYQIPNQNQPIVVNQIIPEVPFSLKQTLFPLFVHFAVIILQLLLKQNLIVLIVVSAAGIWYFGL